ncbi:Thioredoxin domain-containing protein 12, partial [Trichinella murrelli]
LFLVAPVGRMANNMRFHIWPIFMLFGLIVQSEKAKPGNDNEPTKTEPTISQTPNHSDANPYARGWGDDINWLPYEEGIEAAKTEKKPVFLLIHKSWCPACQVLKKKFVKAKPIIELSKYFIMINAQDDEEPWEEDFKPDGAYIPRILFLDTEGNVMKDIKNPSENFDQYTHYYSAPSPIIKSMKTVLSKLNVVGNEVLDNIDDGDKAKKQTVKSEL